MRRLLTTFSILGLACSLLGCNHTCGICDCVRDCDPCAYYAPCAHPTMPEPIVGVPMNMSPNRERPVPAMEKVLEK